MQRGLGLIPRGVSHPRATGLWGLDNNLTRNISAKDPVMIVAVKGLAAGGISLLLAAAIGSSFPAPVYSLVGLLLGSISYGVSILLFVRAAQHWRRPHRRIIWRGSLDWRAVLPGSFPRAAHPGILDRLAGDGFRDSLAAA